MIKFAEFKKASRFQVVPVMVIPVILGGLGAWAWHGGFHPVLFLITLIGAAALHLFSNMINDLWDYRNEVDVAATTAEDAIATNSGFLTNGVWSERRFAAWTWGLFGVSLLCGLALTFLAGYWVAIYGVLGALIAYFYVAPPIRFGYRGKGYSELAILVAFGVLPVLGSYYVQTSGYDARALLLSLPIGLLTTLILFNHHFLHWRADSEAGKQTLVVVLGEERALRFSGALLALACVTLVIAVLYGALPWYALAALAACIPIVRVYKGLGSTNPSPAYLPLMGASLKVTVRVGMWMIVSLLLKGLLG